MNSERDSLLKSEGAGDTIEDLAEQAMDESEALQRKLQTLVRVGLACKQPEYVLRALERVKAVLY
jgi:hypothetical protein